MAIQEIRYYTREKDVVVELKRQMKEKQIMDEELPMFCVASSATHAQGPAGPESGQLLLGVKHAVEGWVTVCQFSGGDMMRFSFTTDQFVTNVEDDRSREKQEEVPYPQEKTPWNHN